MKYSIARSAAPAKRAAWCVFKVLATCVFFPLWLAIGLIGWLLCFCLIPVYVVLAVSGCCDNIGDPFGDLNTAWRDVLGAWADWQL